MQNKTMFWNLEKTVILRLSGALLFVKYVKITLNSSCSSLKYELIKISTAIISINIPTGKFNVRQIFLQAIAAC